MNMRQLLTAPNPYKVLVIDDEGATLTMFRLFLSAYGYSVLAAQDGEAGLALVQKHEPEIVFTDIKMPNMDGLQVLKEIKHMSPRTEVIVITGHGDMDLVVQALNLDATDFINKPIKRTALDAALHRACQRLQDPVPATGTLSFSQEDNLGRIQIAGTLRREHREQLVDICRQARQLAGKPILFEFMTNAAVDGQGISKLITCLSAIRKNGQKVVVFGLSENFKVIFKMVGVARLAALYDNETDALTALGLIGD